AGALPFGTPMYELPRRQTVRINGPKGVVTSVRVPVDVNVNFAGASTRRVSVHVDTDFIWEGDHVPADLYLDAWQLAEGEHRLTVVVRSEDGFYDADYAYFTVDRGVAFTQPEARRTLSGTAPVALRQWGVP